MEPTVKTLVNSLSFYVCWFATAYGVAYGWPWLGPVLIGSYLVLHWGFIQESRREMAFILAGGFVGYAADNLFYLTGTVNYHEAGWMIFAPVWMLFVWFSFLSLFHVSLKWLRRRWVVAAVLGGLGGPLSYQWAQSIGVFSLGDPYGSSMAVLGLTWGLMTPFLFWLSARFPFEHDRTAPRSFF